MIAAAAAATRTNGKQETGRLAAEEDFGDFQEKSNDMVNGYYDDPNVQTFDEMMQMTTDCVVEPVQVCAAPGLRPIGSLFVWDLLLTTASTLSKTRSGTTANATFYCSREAFIIPVLGVLTDALKCVCYHCMAGQPQPISGRL
ncbi:unnamed protein product [Dibothriocephalus latus]|uniref:Uncharacterized protein n=1 Tax=Dibothriocephalus latus TaxID=60516 RepID=A0A3P7R9N2_DIBLA|nr:unnamed protein product [Dibothriocephalus latus]